MGQVPVEDEIGLELGQALGAGQLQGESEIDGGVHPEVHAKEIIHRRGEQVI